MMKNERITVAKKRKEKKSDLMFRDLGKADYRIVNIHLVCILISGE
jgi:hypothetical protein